MSGAERIAEAFATARANGSRAALMPYLMGGFPDLETSRRIGLAYAEHGASLVELGVPFSDPLADGPTVHQAGTSALRAGATLEGVIGVATTIAEAVPVIVMCYSNPMFARGMERFLDALARSGASGLIVPDLPLEEAPSVLELCDARGVALVPLVAPNTPEHRMARIGARARGFMYAVSVTGTTGERASLDGDLRAVLARARAHTEVPVAVGFGIATPEQAADAAGAGADGVIIGSRLVRAAADADDPVAEIGRLTEEFSGALSEQALG